MLLTRGFGCAAQVELLPPGLIGLALVQIMSVTGRIGWVVRSAVDLVRSNRLLDFATDKQTRLAKEIGRARRSF